MKAKSVEKIVDMYPGLSPDERKRELMKDRMKTEFERMVAAAESIYGKLSKQAYNDLAGFHMNYERK